MQINITGDQELIPTFMHKSDAGCDLRAASDGIIGPLSRKLVGTGIAIQLPENYAAFVHPRSGLALKQGVTVLNTPGTIDAGYTGEIGVILFNSSDEPFEYQRGDRIAQLVFQEIIQPTFIFVSQLEETDRGSAGFGSTGVVN